MKAYYYLTIALLTVFLVGSLSCNQKENNEKKSFEINDSTSKIEAVVKDISYKKYCNSRFGFCLDYPYEILFPQGESDNGDGQTFKSKSAENYLQVSRDYRDMLDETGKFVLEDAYRLDTWSKDPQKPNRVFTYKKLGKNNYVVSGYNNGKVFYQKTIISNDVLATCMIVYNENEKLLYDKICERMYISFK